MADDAPGGENAERPEWLPEKFKSPEDIAKAYAEAERKIAEQGQQLTAKDETLQTFAQQLEALAAAQTQPTHVDQSQVNNQWNEMYESDPLGTIVLLNQQLAEQTRQELRKDIQELTGAQQQSQLESIGLNAVAAMKERYSDWNETKELVQAELVNNPVFSDESPVWQSLVGATAALDQAYRNVKSSQTATDDVPYRDTARDMKLAAQGATGSGGRPAPADEGKESWDRIKNAGHRTYAEIMASGR